MSTSFSERYGFKETIRALQIQLVTPELKASLWNILFLEFFMNYSHLELQKNSLIAARRSDHENFIYNSKSVQTFIFVFWSSYLKRPLDELLENVGIGRKYLTNTHMVRWYFFDEFTWYEIYDFLELLLNYFDSYELTERINVVLKRELSAWRFVGNCFTQITSEQEILMIEEALNDNQFQSVSSHLSQALQLMSDKQNPDYRNSIKESISAVESLARIITNNPNATLGQALGKIEQSGKLHPTLKSSFSALYGYTSQENGIRHAMVDEPNLSVDEAKFFLLSCTSFINYLKAKM